MRKPPTTAMFPGGYRIRIVTCPRPFCPKGERALALDEKMDAGWDVDTRTVYLWEGLTPRQKWLKLAHELTTHAAGDYALWVRQKVGAE